MIVGDECGPRDSSTARCGGELMLQPAADRPCIVER